MINGIGFLPNSAEIAELIACVPSDEVKKRLEYLQIPALPDTPASDDSSNADSSVTLEEMPVIKSTDSILYCTPNSEEISNIAFYGYDSTEMYFHHDQFVFSTIIDSCSIVANNRYVAAATFEQDIMVYDVLAKFSALPQELLCGHTGPVTCIKNKYDKLMSCSEDKTMIQWDVNEMRLREQRNYEIGLEKFDFEGNNLIFGEKTYLSINNESIALENEMEQLRIKDNIAYVSDTMGNMVVYDIRRAASPVLVTSLHSGSIVDFCFVRDWIITASTDKTVKMWKMEENTFVCKAVHEQMVPVYSIGFNEYSTHDNEIFVGNEEDLVYPIKLEELP